MLLSSLNPQANIPSNALQMACTFSNSPRPHAREVARQSFHFVGKTVLIRHGAESRVHDWCLTLFLRAGKAGHGMLRVSSDEVEFRSTQQMMRV